MEKFHLVDTQANEKYVVNIMYVLIGTDELGNSDFIIDCVDFEVSNNMENFIPFEQLTQELTESWILAEMGTPYIDNLKNIIKDKINYKITPKTPAQVASAPWNN